MIARLSRADVLRIDLATVARGMDRLRAGGEAEQPSLVVPVSYVSLSNQATRAQIATILREAGNLVRRGVICEVTDIEGVPQSALLSSVSLIRPFCLFVVGRLHATPPTSMTVGQLKGAGLQALSAAMPPAMDDAQLLDWGKVTIDAAKRVARSVLVYGLESPRQAGIAALLGATHASLRYEGVFDG
jgi:hypothetical protein